MSTTHDTRDTRGTDDPGEPGPAVHFETQGRDMDEALHLYEAGYNGAGLHLNKTSQPFSYRYTAKGDEDVTLRTSRLSASIRGSVQPEGEYVVAWLTAGRGVMDVGRDEVTPRAGQPFVFPTGRRYAFRFDDAAQSLVQLSDTYLERLAAERVGSEPVRLHFNHAQLPDDAALRRWRVTIASVAGSILGNDTGTLLRAEANALAANALLDTFPYEGPRRGVLLLPPSNGRLAAALDYIHANPDQPLTTTGIAEAAGLSLRGLQHAFNRQLEQTPTEYLRGIRLDRVRAELLEAGPGDSTVAAVAKRWGFSHSGRFSSAYVGRFGEYPAETLRR